MKGSRDSLSLLLFLLVQTDISPQNDSPTDAARWSAIQRKVQEHNVLQAFALFRENGIEPILIKGLAAAVNYPDSMHRPSIDMDLAVAASNFQSASVFANGLPANGLAIDLHMELRHFDTLSWADLFSRSQQIKTEVGSYRVLCPEDHLRVLAVHWLNDGGVNRERLWDICYLIENRSADFDWDRALNVVSPRRRRWILCTIGLAHRYLGLDLSGTPVAIDAADLPEWLTKTVEREWKNGVKLFPLWAVLRDRVKLWQQLKLRINPNPIRATIEMEGSFDARTRIFYKVGNFFQRLSPSLKRNVETIKQR